MNKVEVQAKKDRAYKEEVEKLHKVNTQGSDGATLGVGETEVVDYVPITKEEEITRILDNHKQYTSEAPLGYIFSDEVAKIAGKTCTIQGKTVSLQSILYSGRKVIDRPKEKTKLYGGMYTEAQVMSNLKLMKVYKNAEYEQEVWNIMKQADANRPSTTGMRLGGGSWRGYRR